MAPQNRKKALMAISLSAFILLLPFVLTNCTKEEIDLNEVTCDSDCFTIQGSFYDTLQSLPVENLLLELRHKSTSYNPIFPYNRKVGSTTTKPDGTFKIVLDPKDFIGDKLYFELNIKHENYAVQRGIGYLSMVTKPKFIFTSDSSIIDSTITLDVQLIPKSYISVELKSWQTDVRSITIWPKGVLSNLSYEYFSNESFPIRLPIAAYSESELEVTIKKEGNTTNQNKKLLSKGIGETQTVKLFL